MCFALTGATGLVYEVVWARRLELDLGSTQYAVSTVLGVFMLGLSVGGALGGRLADRLRSPLVAYGAAEALVGLYCLATPALFEWVGELSLRTLDAAALHDSSFRPTQIGLAALALLLPAALMGTTLPLVVRSLLRSHSEVGARVSLLYALNTLGAVIGCLATGFWLISWLGIRGSLVATGVVDIATGATVVAWALRGGAAGQLPDDAAAAPQRALGPRTRVHEREHRNALPAAVVLATVAISGFAALAYEVLWFRVLALVIGSSIYAVTIMLATFLAGIAAGSAWLAPLLLRRGSGAASLAGLQLAIAFAALLGTALFPSLPALFLWLFDALGEHFWLFTSLQSAICALLMAAPTLCMGAVLPLAAQLRAASDRDLGRGVGDVYAVNTAAAIAGSIAAGFWLQPALGIQSALAVVASANAALGLALWLSPWTSPGPPWERRCVAGAAALAACFAGLAWTLPGWDALRMTVGPYVNQGESRRFLGGYGSERSVDELLYYREGVHAVISVRRALDGSWISYQSNGKWEGSVGETAANWSLLGHIPMLLHPRADRALLVGLGTGVTLGAMLDYDLSRVDVAEIEPAVVEAAGFFGEANGDALSDPRVQVHHADGRTFLGARGESYDVIVSGVSDPWISGVSNLFTREYFERVSARLRPDGVAAIWFQNYRISPDELRSALNTLAAVFSDVSVWAPHDDPADLVLVAKKQPLAIDAEALFRALSGHADPEALQRAGLRHIFDFLNLLLLQDADLRSYVRGAPVHTDDRPHLEFSLARKLYTDVREGIVERAAELVRQIRQPEPPVVLAPELELGFYYGLASTYSYFAYRDPQTIALFQRVLQLDPGHAEARRYLELKHALPAAASESADR